jgi:hypothetical protein
MASGCVGRPGCERSAASTAGIDDSLKALFEDLGCNTPEARWFRWNFWLFGTLEWAWSTLHRRFCRRLV